MENTLAVPDNAIQAAFRHGQEQRADFNVSDVPVHIVPEDMKAIDLFDLVEKTRTTPRHLKQKFEAHSPTAFIEYFNRYAVEGMSAIFIDRINNVLVGVIDYHENAAVPHFATHRVTYRAPKTEEASKWLENNNKKMSQEDFALFIEDGQREIIEPNAANMLEIAASLKASNNVDFKSSIRLDNGELQFNYTENINGSAGVNGQLTIPEKIKLVIAPFKGSAPYELEARFRYRINQGGLIMWYTLITPHLVIQDAINDIEKQIIEGIEHGDVYQGVIDNN